MRAGGVLLALLLLVLGLSFAAYPVQACADTAFTITGSGWGHGIGLSQWGAKGFAQHGYTYRQILTHYYRGTTVETAPGKTVTVGLDSKRAARGYWTVQAATVGGRISVSGVVAPADRPYRFSVNSGQLRVIDVYTGKLWRTFSSPVTISSTASGSGRTEETGAGVTYGGRWTIAAHGAMSAGKYAYSATSGATVTYRFSGTSIDWIGSVGPSYGQAEVYVDGVKKATVSAYASSYAHQQQLWGISGLSSAVHTLTIKVLGTHEAASTADAVIVDAFDVGGSSSGESALIQVVDASGPFNQTYVRYRGTLTITLSGSGVILRNKIDIEQYLYGVVPRESPSSWPAEALKAQAVAARAYALTETNSELACTTASQVYNGHSRGADRTKTTMHEASSTNAAVDATRGQVVKYGSTIVRTFFFSCSGGHTANIQDVWGSAAKPYYTGVPDPYEADAGCPYANSWGSPIVYTGTSLAKALGYSSPVSRLVLDVASTGHVRNVQVVHVDGTSHTLTGDRFRSKLGLRSTKFACDNTLRVADPGVFQRFEQDDPRITYSTGWTKGTLAALSGGSYVYASAYGPSATARFYGTSITVIGSRGPSYGKAEIWVDGARKGTIDAYGATYDHAIPLWEVEGLSLGTHTVIVKTLGTRNSASTSNVVVFDAFDIGLAQPSVAIPPSGGNFRVEDTDSRIRYEGLWVGGTLASMSGNSYKYAYKAGAQLTATFAGTSLSLVGPKGPGYGSADVYVDGVRLGTVSQYAAAYTPQLTLFATGDLGLGEHTVVVRVLGTHEAASTGDVVILDALDLADATRATSAVGLGRSEESTSSLKYQGSWVTADGWAMSGGAYSYSQTSGATLSMRFSGTSASWVGPVGPSYGKAEVYVDGVMKGVVSCTPLRTGTKNVSLRRVR